SVCDPDAIVGIDLYVWKEIEMSLSGTSHHQEDSNDICKVVRCVETDELMFAKIHILSSLKCERSHVRTLLGANKPEVAMQPPQRGRVYQLDFQSNSDCCNRFNWCMHQNTKSSPDILNGKWILTTDWLQACAKAGKLVDEEPYKVFLDTHGASGSPKAGRLRVKETSYKLDASVAGAWLSTILHLKGLLMRVVTLINSFTRRKVYWRRHRGSMEGRASYKKMWPLRSSRED
ncbi:BRCA1-associated RING domain protein 1 isoform X1, partial [Tanacetum coccineum]